jgi:hypothetical protein
MVMALVVLGDVVVVTVVDVDWAEAGTAARSPRAAIVAIKACLMLVSSGLLLEHPAQ